MPIFESFELVKETAQELQYQCNEIGIPWILKCSFDKANRQSAASFRGPGMEEALAGLEKIKGELNCPVITDVHECSQVDRVAEVADVLQIPAFLCRQTDLLQKSARSGKVLNIKKGQFMAPWDMKAVCEKASSIGNSQILLCERGVSFGYNRLIVDMCSLPEMRSLGYPVIMDATHSVQLPGGKGSSSDGNRDMISVLAKAAVAIGVDGLFLECHPDPDKALCDGPNSLELKDVPKLLKKLLEISRAAKS